MCAPDAKSSHGWSRLYPSGSPPPSPASAPLAYRTVLPMVDLPPTFQALAGAELEALGPTCLLVAAEPFVDAGCLTLARVIRIAGAGAVGNAARPRSAQRAPRACIV